MEKTKIKDSHRARALLFIIFCKGLNLHLTYLSRVQFADDPMLYTSSKSLRLWKNEVNHDLEIVSDWFRANKLTLNIDKSICLVFPPKIGNITDITGLTVRLGDH